MRRPITAVVAVAVLAGLFVGCSAPADGDCDTDVLGLAAAAKPHPPAVPKPAAGSRGSLRKDPAPVTTRTPHDFRVLPTGSVTTSTRHGHRHRPDVDIDVSLCD